MKILRITSLKPKLTTNGAKSKPKVAPVLKINGTFYKQAKSMCFVNKQSVLHILVRL